MKSRHPIAVNALRFFMIAALLAASLVALTPPRVAHAATFVVNTTADTDDGLKGNGICADSGGACSLRAAISEANALAGADTITLPARTYTLTIAGASEDANATGDLDLTSDITLEGAGASSTIIDADQLDRALQVFSGATVTLRALALTNGRTPDGSTENAGEYGGGVYNGGTLTIEQSAIRNNTAGNGGACAEDGCYNDQINRKCEIGAWEAQIEDPTAVTLRDFRGRPGPAPRLFEATGFMGALAALGVIGLWVGTRRWRGSGQRCNH